jgi:hypothetical protein
MSREIRCANCGTILYPSLKAIPQLGKVIEILAPHECGEPVEFTVPETSNVARQSAIAAAEGLPFGKKLTEIRKDYKEAFSDALDTGDRRDKREELNISTAPKGLLDMLKSEEMEG